MEVVIGIFLLYFIAKLVVHVTISFIDICVTAWRDSVSVKNRKIIRHWEWLREIGYHETAEIFIITKLR